MFRRLLRLRPFLRFALAFLALGAILGAARWWRHRARHPWMAPIATAPIFADDFAGTAPNPITQSRLDPLRWRVQGDDQILQLTQWGRAPDLKKDADGTSFARLSLQTFNAKPEKAGRFHLATQIMSLDRWKLGTGLEYEARLRARRLPPGLILGFFAYGDAGVWKKTYQKTESDFEFLSHQGGTNIWTHIWDNWNPLREGENDGSLHDTLGVNWNDGSWNTFKIRWYPDRTEWICNGRLIRDEKVVRPGSPMGVWLNLWAPRPDWTDAYNPAIRAARTASTSRTYFYDVDYVRVRRIPDSTTDSTTVEGNSTKNEAVAPVGKGDGLKASYFGTANLAGRAVVRLDPRVDFDWGVHAPDSQLPRDGFSARWEGLVEARHSEITTFSVESDDGARLWVNGRLLLDNWQVQGPAPRLGQIELRAGEKVALRLEMFNRKGAASARLSWKSASTPLEIVPQSQLYPAFRPAAPRFSPGSRALLRPQEIAIQSATRDATIRYTLDGTAPTRQSKTLKNGARLRVGYSALVRADAVIENEVSSEVARAFYTLDDKKPPFLSLDAPAPGAPPKALAGRVFDAGSGAMRVDLVITRLLDGRKWKNGRWVEQEWGIGARIRDRKWSVKAGLPARAEWKAGQYELKAVAYDGAGNIRGARQILVVAGAGEPIRAATSNGG